VKNGALPGWADGAVLADDGFSLMMTGRIGVVGDLANAGATRFRAQSALVARHGGSKNRFDLVSFLKKMEARCAVVSAIA